jgi:hypothetical protein
MEELNGVSDGKIADVIEENKILATEEEDRLPPPSFGFDEKGTFFLQINSKAGFLAMIGFIHKASMWMNDRMEEYEKKKKAESLIKPSNKGFGRFNLFR